MTNKTIFSLLLAGSLALSLTACGAKPEALPGSIPPDSVTSDAASDAVSGASGESDTGAQASYFGKIGSLIGNEATLELCAAPEFMEALQPDDDEDEGDAPGMVGAVEMVPAMTATPSDGEGGVEVDVDKNEPIFTPAYSGESSDFTIPASTEFIDMAGKGRSSLSDLKEGNVIGLDSKDGTIVTVYFLS